MLRENAVLQQLPAFQRERVFPFTHPVSSSLQRSSSPPVATAETTNGHGDDDDDDDQVMADNNDDENSGPVKKLDLGAEGKKVSPART